MKDFSITLMCDAQTKPVRMSNINFLVYYNKKVIFYGLVDALVQYHDAIYIHELLKTIIEKIRSK